MHIKMLKLPGFKGIIGSRQFLFFISIIYYNIFLQIFQSLCGLDLSSFSKNTDPDLHETSSPMISCLQPAEMTIINHNHLINIAPAEGNIPQSAFDMEMKCFPYLFIDGKKWLCSK